MGREIGPKNQKNKCSLKGKLDNFRNFIKHSNEMGNKKYLLKALPIIPNPVLEILYPVCKSVWDENVLTKEHHPHSNNPSAISFSTDKKKKIWWSASIQAENTNK